MKDLSEIDRAKAILGIGPGGRLNFAYNDGYAFTAFQRDFGHHPEEALRRAGIKWNQPEVK